MYGSKFMDDLDDDFPCEEIIVSREVLSPEPLPRRKGKKEKCCQRYIEDSKPCCVYSHSREEIQPVKPREMDFKPCSTLKDTKMKKATKKRISKERDEIYNAEDEYSDPDCSIIYSRSFDVNDQITDEFQPRLGCCTSKTSENVDWIESDTSVSTLPVKESHKGCRSACSSRKSFDFRDDPLKELLPDIPSIPQYNLPDTVETKPEPEVLATALLMSENEDLESAKPAEIFDKLFSVSTAQQTVPMADASVKKEEEEEDAKMIAEPLATSSLMDKDIANETVEENMNQTVEENMNQTVEENTNQTVEESTIDKVRVSAARDSQINETVQQEEPKAIDATRYSSVPGARSKNAREEWMEDNGMLEYVMKAEAAAPPAYRNYVRLNGSVKPSWFAGYALVSPLLPDCIRITSDPGEALLEAWRLCRPRHFDEFSKSFLNTA